MAILTDRDLVGPSTPVAAPVFRPVARVQESILSDGERDVLRVLCRNLPTWVTPNMLTSMGVGGAVLTAIGYIGTNFRPEFLFLASFGLLVNWFGDSLDGSLARYRGIERPRYGFFLDHSMDAASNLVIAIGLGFSPYVDMGAALFTLVGYLLLGLSVFLNSHVSGKFRLSFIGFGPTELRIVMILFNLVVYMTGPLTVQFLGEEYSLHSLSVTLLGVSLVALFLNNVRQTMADLARQG